MSDIHDLRNCPAMRALEQLTPGGSEYVDDIPRCVETVRVSRRALMNALLNQKRAKDAEIAALKEQVEQLSGDVRAVSRDYTNAQQEIAALREALCDLLAEMHDHSTAPIPKCWRDSVVKAERVLAEGQKS